MKRFAGDRLKSALGGAKNAVKRGRKSFAEAREKGAGRPEQLGSERHVAVERSDKRPGGDRVRSAVGDTVSKVKSAAESLKRSDRD